MRHLDHTLEASEGANIPMNAMSYFTSSDARQGKYGSRPKVEIPEKTESALVLLTPREFEHMRDQSSSYLSSTITREGVIPESLVWPGNWKLVMVAVGKSASSQRGNSKEAR